MKVQFAHGTFPRKLYSIGIELMGVAKAWFTRVSYLVFRSF